MTSSIPITWDTGITHEALPILYYLKRLPELELQQRGFIVLPRLPKKNTNNIILLPDLPYSSIPNLWPQVTALDPTTPMTAPRPLVDQIINLLQPTYKTPIIPDISLKPFLASLFTILPDYCSQITAINIIVTYSGTCSQFNCLTPTNHHLTIYFRADANITSLAHVIILALIRHQLQHLEHHSWEEIEAVADFLTTHTSLKQTLSPYSHTPNIFSLRQSQLGRLKLQSQKYLTSLGIPSQNNWQVKNNQIFYSSVAVTQLTTRQHQLLLHLVNHHSQVITNDQIADILWPDGSDYSLWAIVKEIARIRHRLVTLGLPGSLIQSHRKLGYSLV